MQSLIVLASLVFELAGRVKISGRSSPEIRASLEKNYVHHSDEKSITVEK